MAGRTIFITGAGAGIGRAVALAFAGAGWKVGAYDLNPDSVATLAEELSGAALRAGAIDVCDQASIDAALVDFSEFTDGRMDVLFNNAGVAHVGPFEQLDLDKHLAINAVNFAGLMRMTHRAFPLLASTAGAQIINMSSASADYGVPGFTSYSATKFAVRGLTEALNLEWRQHGIHVCDINPPFVDTDMVRAMPTDVTTVNRLGVRLDAADVAAVVMRAATGRKRVHWPVGLQFSVMYTLGQVLPSSLKRRVMRMLSGY